jgi:hypothetical protein
MIDVRNYLDTEFRTQRFQFDLITDLRYYLDSNSLLRKHFRPDYVPAGALMLYDTDINRQYILHTGTEIRKQQNVRRIKCVSSELISFLRINLNSIYTRDYVKINKDIEQSFINFLELENNIFRQIVYLDIEKKVINIHNGYDLVNKYKNTCLLIENDCDWNLNFCRSDKDLTLSKNEIIIVEDLDREFDKLMPVRRELNVLRQDNPANQELGFELSENICALTSKYKSTKFTLWGERRYKNKIEWFSKWKNLK